MTCGRLYTYYQENSVEGQKEFCLNSLFQFKVDDVLVSHQIGRQRKNSPAKGGTRRASPEE
jgi:hypothetical protein